jgi:hypothetical protein
LIASICTAYYYASPTSLSSFTAKMAVGKFGIFLIMYKLYWL